MYDLQELPSTDSRFSDAAGDIWQHRINNPEDWGNDWIFFDDRFQFQDGEDDQYLLKFLCETIHYSVRPSPNDANVLLREFNRLLKSDGYEIYEILELPNHRVFKFRELNTKNMKPIQKIIFGSPGTGKSYQIRAIAQDALGISYDSETQLLKNTVKTVFHPEYTYSDFIGKLLPITQGNSIIYKFYPGHFLKALGMAYKELINNSSAHHLLVIDELNRGNAAAIFGTVFQLLDREDSGWSSYELDLSDMELFGLLETMHLNPVINPNNEIRIKEAYSETSYEAYCEKKYKELLAVGNVAGARVYGLLKERRISIPNNLSIIATINTSDESIYYLDSAFKRRWDWEYVEAPMLVEKVPESLENVKLIIGGTDKGSWFYYIIGINRFIKSNSDVIRRIEDKQIGWWFIKPVEGKVDLQKVKDKLMFYLWDSVFARDKRPLEKFLSTETNQVKLALYSDLLELTEVFMDKIYNSIPNKYFDEVDF